jgi:hypothetical protein
MSSIRRVFGFLEGFVYFGFLTRDPGQLLMATAFCGSLPSLALTRNKP